MGFQSLRGFGNGRYCLAAAGEGLQANSHSRPHTHRPCRLFANTAEAKIKKAPSLLQAALLQRPKMGLSWGDAMILQQLDQILLGQAPSRISDMPQVSQGARPS